MTTGEEKGAAAGKANQVRSMFAEIAPRYDFLNHALSFNTDRRWRRFAVRKLADLLSGPRVVALDLCCGTGDLSLELAEFAPTWGLDFCHPMLVLGLKKIRASNRPVMLVEGDALRAPFPDGSFDAVTIAFGLRNLESITLGLAEIYRLLKRGGRAAVLEFSHPRIPVLRSLFHFYFTRMLPLIGNAVSGSRYAYSYLPASVGEFPDQAALAELMRSVGFCGVEYYNLSGGIAALHLGHRK